MQDFGTVDWQGPLFLAIFAGNHIEHPLELIECFTLGRHERVAALDRWNFGDPAIRQVSIQHYFIVIESHIVILGSSGVIPGSSGRGADTLKEMGYRYEG